MLKLWRAFAVKRNQYRILVDITNSVLAHLDMDGLISEVSKKKYIVFSDLIILV